MGNPEILVQFDQKSFENGADATSEGPPVWMTRASLKVYEPPKVTAEERKKQKEDDVAQAAAKEAALPVGIPCQARTKKQAFQALTQQVGTSLYHMYVSKLPPHSLVRFPPEGGAVAAQDG